MMTIDSYPYCLVCGCDSEQAYCRACLPDFPADSSRRAKGEMERDRHYVGETDAEAATAVAIHQARVENLLRFDAVCARIMARVVPYHRTTNARASRTNIRCGKAIYRLNLLAERLLA